MRKAFALGVAIALLCLGRVTQADVYNLGPGLTNLETVTVGNAGNTADTRYGNPACGGVDYTYNIGKYEVTAAQYTDFLNHKAKSDPYGLYNTNMDTAISIEDGCNIKRSGTSGSYTYSVASDWANRPVNFVSYWDSCRFANWLNNGQGDGDTETGAYTLNDYNGDDGRWIGRNAGAQWFLPSADEWHKAAYYKGGGTNAGYWDYPTQSNIAPSNEGCDGYTDPGNHANYYNGPYLWAGRYTIGNPYFRTNVGEFENSASAYGTFDQGGNVWEWNEAISFEGGQTTRDVRGGSFHHFMLNGSYDLTLRAFVGFYWPSHPNLEYDCLGFRVSQVPEPSALLPLLCGLGGVVCRRRR